MPSLTNANVQSKLIRALERAGFERRSGGKHTSMEHPDGRYTTIPIVRQCGLTEAEYIELYSGRRKRK